MGSLSDNLYKLRKEKRLTQEQAAKGADIILRSYCRYEKGEREPAASTLIKLANFYGVSIDYLVGRSDVRG